MLIRKEYCLSPAVTVTDEGMVTIPPGEAESVTTVPAGQVLLKVKVPFDWVPPSTLFGEIVNDVIAGGLTVRTLLDLTSGDA